MRSSPLHRTPCASHSSKLTVSYLFRFSLPLALTFLMMSGAAPLVSNGITWMHGATGERIHLSAFLMTFATALLIYSPMFTARNVAIRTVTDRRSLWRFTIFHLACAGASSVILVAVSQVDQLGHLVFQTMLGTQEEIELLARQGMFVFVPIPAMIALRGLGQGCHISNNQGWYVGIGTALRLGVMALFVFGYAIHHNLSGPVLGGMTYLSGISVETAFVLLTLWNKPQWRTIGRGPLLSYRQFTHYTGALMVASVLNVFAGPILIYLINVGRQPGENGASYNLLRDTAWLLFSTLMTVQPVIIAHATSPRNLRIIGHFSVAMVAGLMGITMLVALTPLHDVIFIGWLDVDNVLIQQLTFKALLWMIPVPLINMLWLTVSALHTRSGRTTWITAGNLVGLGLLVAAAIELDFSSSDGAVIAIIGLAAFNLVSAAVQSVGLFNGGLRAALSPKQLADELNAPEPNRTEPTTTGAPVCEHARA